MSQNVTNALYIMLIGIITAFLISTIFSLSKTSVSSANTASTNASKLVAQMTNYDLDRVDCRAITGKEVIRIIEQYYTKCEITLFTSNRIPYYEESGVQITDKDIGISNKMQISSIYNTSNSSCYVNENSEFYVTITYDENDNLKQIEIKEE